METTPQFEEQYKGYKLLGTYLDLHPEEARYDYRISAYKNDSLKFGVQVCAYEIDILPFMRTSDPKLESRLRAAAVRQAKSWIDRGDFKEGKIYPRQIIPNTPEEE